MYVFYFNCGNGQDNDTVLISKVTSKYYYYNSDYFDAWLDPGDRSEKSTSIFQ